jgi:CRISPR-associated protein Csd1
MRGGTVILQALTNYYNLMVENGQLPEQGYSKAKVSFALNINESGDLIGIIPLQVPTRVGKKTVYKPQEMEVPEQITRTVNTGSNFLCDNSGYVLGIDKKDNPTRTKECFNLFQDLHRRVLEGVETPCARAVLAFIDKWVPEDQKESPVLKEYLDDILSGGNLVFYLNGTGYVHEDPKVREAWQEYKSKMESDTVMQCLVTGKMLPIARIHTAIKGVKGAQSSGAYIVSFNSQAYESYGHEKQQGANAPVSERAAFAYTTALNFMLGSYNHRIDIGDSAVVFWAESTKPQYLDLFNFLLMPSEEEIQGPENVEDTKTTYRIRDLFRKVASGMPIEEADQSLDPDVPFYVLALSPNAGRISIRFFLSGRYGSYVDRLVEHYRNMEIARHPDDYQYVPLWKVMLETVPKASKDKSSSPLLTGAVLRAILSGQPYPSALYSAIMIRIRADRDINRARAGIIKAYLIKKYNYQKYKEVLTVALNPECKEKAYILGRLFSVLEKVQEEANPGINTTIKDRYFTSACATPASVFPVLLRLSNHHIAKAQYGKNAEIKIRELLNMLEVNDDPFPANLTLEEQGIFILGYYHQKQANYEKVRKE